MVKKILVIAAHPDDEVLGAGATMKKYADLGNEVYCLILGRGVAARFDGASSEINLQEGNRNLESLAAAKILGIQEVFFEDFPDQRFDSIDFLEIVKTVERYITQVKPNIVYTHYENDLNLDHRLTFQATITACRPCNDDFPSEIYSFEILSSTEWQTSGEKFKPTNYEIVESQIKFKLEALQAYHSELRSWPHSRSLKGVEILAQYRGLECGKKYAEAFKLVRGIHD